MADDATIRRFGTLGDGRTISRISLESGPLRVDILDLGATLHGVEHAELTVCPTLGGARAEDYAGVMSLFGPVIGPVANRISGATLQIDGQPIHLEANQDGRHSLHSGAAGAQHKIWRIAEAEPSRCRLEVDLPHGEGGFPGNRRLSADYAIEDGALHVTFTATTDRPSPVNMALHGFWTAQAPTGWAGQTLTIHADAVLPVDDDTLPTGEVRQVAGTPYDFRSPRLLGADTPTLDHNFCLSGTAGTVRPAVTLSAPDGAFVGIETDAPGLQVFDMSKFGSGEAPTLHGAPYHKFAALAFEPQHWPDAPGRPEWPDILLRPGRTYRQRSIYRFGRM